jgi:Protein of unknown function (DUF1553)/Protein of unknown function (DUF1549)
MHRTPMLPYLMVAALLTGGLAIAGQPNESALDGGSSAPEMRTDGRRFELDIQPILTARGCNSGPCHGKARGQNGFALSLLGFDADMDFNAIVKESRGRRLFPAAPENSLLLLKATGELPHGGGIRLDPKGADYQQLLEWIREGTGRIKSDDPKLERITIAPEPRPMVAGQEIALTVTAHYSNGTVRNVTDTCAYQSNEASIISVKPNGTLRAGTIPGEATIMARYMGLITTWSSAIPRPEKVEASLYQGLPKNNFIDALAYEKLAELNILPSEGCDDAQYLRRAFLDVIGRLPTANEAREFLQSSESNKRQKLVDGLLERLEYGDFWANKWADLLRPNPYHVGIKATMSLDGWLRDAFRRNIPYDQFVRELLTAQGSTWRNGAVTIFRDRRQPEELVTITSQLFLGVRLDCAKCHQHPFEVYGQNDFYGFASFFSRVQFKGTGISAPISGGEEMVHVKANGGVKHPLTQDVVPTRLLKGDVVDVPAGEDPREVLVNWMTSPDNPYFAQVAVNRIWADLFGIGIVDPVDDLRATNPPSNPALLAALAKHYRDVGFNQKELLRTILASNLYSLSSRPNATNFADNRNFSRHYRQRLRAEVLMDAVADVTGQPGEFRGMPKGTRAMQLWTHRTESEFLDAFGRPDPNQDPPCERSPNATVVQALHMMNSPAIQNRIIQDVGTCHRLAEDSTKSPEAILDELYLMTFSRLPTATERAELAKEFSREGTTRRQVIEDVLWSLMNSPEFLYKD